MILKLFRFIKLSIKQALTGGFVALALVALLMLSVPHMAGAKEESEDVNALTSLEQMAQSLENALPRLQAELGDLKTELRQLETIQNAARTQIKAYDSQNTVHSQLLLMSSPRIEDLENAVKDSRLASHTLTQQVKTFEKNWDSKSISFQKTTDRIEMARKQIADIRQSQLSDAQKQQLEAATQKLLEVLREKKQLEERYLKIYGDLLDQIRSVVEAKRALGEKLMVQLESLKKASLIQRLDHHRDLSGKALLEDLQFFRDRIRAFFRLATWRAGWQQIKMGGFTPTFVFLAALAVIIIFRDRYLVILKRIEARCEDRRGTTGGCACSCCDVPFHTLA